MMVSPFAIYFNLIKLLVQARIASEIGSL